MALFFAPHVMTQRNMSRTSSICVLVTTNRALHLEVVLVVVGVEVVLVVVGVVACHRECVALLSDEN